MSDVRISACLIVRDEEERLPRALESVAFCDEVVVVDSGSQDRTVEIARAAGARVIENPWPGFAIQRNVALDAAQGRWVLEIDADERVTAELRESILRVVEDPPDDVGVVSIPRRERLLGRRLGPSAKYPQYRNRLIRAGAARHDTRRQVHEGLNRSGHVWTLEGDLEHDLAADLSEALSDVRTYARLEASQLRGSPTARAVAIGVLVRPAAKAVYRLAVDGGWRDGWAGGLRIGMDTATDALTWVHAARLRLNRATADDHGRASGHFSDLGRGDGPIRIVALARGEAAAGRCEQWLTRAREAGADVVLITDADPVPTDRRVRLRRLPQFTPLRIVRALDAERQLSPIDAYLVRSHRAQRVLKLLPPAQRALQPSLRLDADPRESVLGLSVQNSGKGST